MNDRPTPRPRFESWGRYPRLTGDLVPLYWHSDFPAAIPKGKPILPVGLGRSYGDVCLCDGGALVQTRGMRRLIDFNRQTGALRCESGVSLGEILQFAVPRGWFLPITPGTKYVTVGGAIANDVHGKNHHMAGTFGRHTTRFELARSDGSRMICSTSENPAWYRATIGGLGLTGLITWAEIQLRPIVSRVIEYKAIKFHGIEEFLALSHAAARSEFTVAWIDCVARGRDFARGVFMQGAHGATAADLHASQEPRLSVPFTFPALALNRFSVGRFNHLYYHRQFAREKTVRVDYERFFYPLDSVLHWNRIYGRDGLLQFQCVLPPNDVSGIVAILRAITASGLASFLAVLKVFGDLPSPGLLSFPRPGVTLALDFPVRGQRTFGLVDRLGEITRDHGGSIYPAKDARMTPRQFEAFYPGWRDFARHIDPRFDSAFWRRVTATA